MRQEIKNYWNEFEYDKLRLLLHHDKVESILDVLQGKKEFDEILPVSVEIHLTDFCNLRCPWCTDRLLHENKAVLDTKYVKGLLDLFAESGSGVTLEGGGEPTLHRDFSEIVRYGREKGVDLGLITNGTQDISECINSFKWVRVSLDSSSPGEYLAEKGFDCFGQVMDNLRRYREVRDCRETFLGVGYVLTNRNYGNIEDTVRKLDEYGVDYVYFRPVEEADEIRPSKEELYELKRRMDDLTENRRIKYLLRIDDRLVEKNGGMPCVAHSLTSIVHANADVFLCEKRRHDLIFLGNIMERDFLSVWRSENRVEASKKLMEASAQCGCSACRMTAFNNLFCSLDRAHSVNFI